MNKSGKSGESRGSDKQIYEPKSAGFSSVLLRQSDVGRVKRFLYKLRIINNPRFGSLHDINAFLIQPSSCSEIRAPVERRADS